MTLPRRKVWLCLGETDEWHLFCPFATTDEAKAASHAEHPGHWCVTDVEPTGLWTESLRLEAEANAT